MSLTVKYIAGIPREQFLVASSSDTSDTPDFRVAATSSQVGHEDRMLLREGYEETDFVEFKLFQPDATHATLAAGARSRARRVRDRRAAS